MKPQLTIEAFADWCEKQPAEKSYDYMDTTNCAFCQYLRSLGIEANVGQTRYYVGDALRPMPDGIDRAVDLGVRTFGALAARLRASQ